VLRLVFVHDELGVRKQPLAVRHVGQAGRMIRMHVRQQNRVDRLRIDAGGCEVALNHAGGRQEIIAGTGVDDRDAALGMDQESVDIGSPRRPKGLLEEPVRGFEVDIAHHVEAAVEIAVADRGDDDVSDLAMIDAGNLLGGLRSHGKNLWRVRREV
jgi:hypothetical protein